MENYEETYEKNWKHIIEKDGVVSLDQVKRELHDYSFLINNTSQVFDAVTGSRVSQPNVIATQVIEAFNEAVEDRIEDAIADAVSDGELIRVGGSEDEEDEED